MPSDQPSSRSVPSTGDLPGPPRAQGAYRTATATDHLVMTAGMTPRVDGVLRHAGRIGDDITLDEGRAAAALAVSNAVSAVAELLGSTDAIGRALRMTVYVNAVDGFTDHSRVADGASQQLVTLLGEERGAVVRSAVGVASLPGGACVEVELTCLR
ncbi:RidA family protein [Aeromicrobium chenweiae]|uniref:RidA family protein n=1 Tax=Aeromicrobium chenweiae TaxID=2079793 RepID=UPI00143D90C4|nr:RidA family protein [Aeromicrobium chenweiae]